MDPADTLDGSDSGATPLEAVEAPEEAAPSETPAETGTEAPVEAPAEPTTAPEPELFELPDGRKVEASELSREFKENFYPEFTRRSQELARLTQAPKQPPAETTTDPLEDPNYIPPTYAELAAQIETKILTGMSDRAQREADARQAIEDNAVAQLTEVKAIDPNVNEGMLFQYAMKHGFQDLRLAHGAMRELNEAVKKAQTMTKDNAAARMDPVSARPGATGSALDPDAFSSSVEYLRAVKAQGKSK